MLGKAPIALILLLASCAGPANLHRVDQKVWRSSQPARHQFCTLEEDGIRKVLCLRRWHSDRQEAVGLEKHHVRMNAGEIRDEDIVAALKVLVASDEPVLVHCFHGTDRTGVVVVMYRMVVQDWPRERAIAEFMEPRYGHHAEVFPNIRRYLETVDVEKIRREWRGEERCVQSSSSRLAGSVGQPLPYSSRSLRLLICPRWQYGQPHGFRSSECASG